MLQDQDEQERAVKRFHFKYLGLIRTLFIKRGEPDTHYVKSSDEGYVRIIYPSELYRKKGKRANWAYDRINEGAVY